MVTEVHNMLGIAQEAGISSFSQRMSPGFTGGGPSPLGRRAGTNEAGKEVMNGGRAKGTTP